MLRFPLIHPMLLAALAAAGKREGEAVYVATGDERLQRNLLVTIGYITPRLG